MQQELWREENAGKQLKASIKRPQQSQEETTMRVRHILICIVLLSFVSAQAQNAPGKSAPDPKQFKIDPAKEADIRKLMDVIGTTALMRKMMENMGNSIKPLMVKTLPPGDYRNRLVDLFFVKFQSKANPQQLADLIVPLYDKYLSDEELKEAD